MQPLIDSSENPQAADREAVLKTLVAFNDGAHGPSRYKPVAVLLRDPESGSVRGGLWASYLYDWLFVELLVVPEDYRGQGLGRRLMAEAEGRARALGAAGIWLDTFSFQARGFYEKLGFSVCGEIADHPRGGARFFMMKRLNG